MMHESSFPCPRPDKVRWMSKRGAKREIRRLVGKGGDINLNVYLCDCGWWHVGHKLRRAAA